MAVSDYSTTPNNNSQISGIDISEGCNPAGMNNAVRQLMADIRANSDSATADRRARDDGPLFDTIAGLFADTVLSYSGTAGDFGVVTAGDFITAKEAGAIYEVAASDATDQHKETAGGVKLYVSTKNWVISSRMFGAVWDGTTDDTAALDAAMRFGATNGLAGYDYGTARVRGTIAPGGEYRWDWQSATINPDVPTVGDDFALSSVYTEVLENPSGGTYTGSGKYCVFDLSGCKGSINEGHLLLQAAAPGNMKLESREGIPANLVAISSATASSATISWPGYLQIIGFGYGFFHGDQRGDVSPKMLPYTGWTFNQLEIQFCLVPMQAGESGNSFDEWQIGSLKMFRNAGVSLIRGTTINVDSGLLQGFREGDVEDQTMTLTAGSTTAVMSGPNSRVNTNTWIALDSGGLSNDTSKTNAQRSMGFVAKVISKDVDGVTLTLSKAPEADAVAQPFWGNPPTIKLFAAGMTFAELYMEDRWDKGLEVNSFSTITANQYKITLGPTCSRYDAPVIFTGHQECGGTLVLQDNSINNNLVKSMVGVVSLFDDVDTYNEVNVDLFVSGAKGRIDTNSDLIRLVEPDTTDIYSGYSSAIDYLNPTMNLTAQTANGHFQIAPHRRGELLLNSGPQSGHELVLVADTTGVTVSGTFSGPVSGVYTKASGGEGRLDHDETFVAGALYLVTINLATWNAGLPQVRWYDSGGVLIDTQVVLAREAVRRKLWLTAPTGATRLSLFDFTNGDLTVDEFTVQRVLQ